MKEKKTSKKIEEAAKEAQKAAWKAAKTISKKAEKVWKAAAKKFDEVSSKVSNVAWELADERELEEKFNEGAEKTKQAATWISKWWKKSSTVEKVTTIVWIILLICALWVLRSLIWGILLLLFWILWVTGYFDEYLEDICDRFSDKKSNRK
jgi:hypothetical protein